MSFIAIAGNIGVGKSALTERLAARLGWKAVVEPATENPYLPDFYADMNRWAFHSQIFVLAHRLRQHQEFARNGGAVIQDRSVYENAEIFARILYDRGYLTPRDWQTYSSLYQSLIALLPAPALIIYLKASVPTLVARIQARGRSYEQKIDLEYLAELNRLYDQWAAGTTVAPVLTVSIDDTDLRADESAMSALATNIAASLPTQQLPIYTATN